MNAEKLKCPPATVKIYVRSKKPYLKQIEFSSEQGIRLGIYGTAENIDQLRFILETAGCQAVELISAGEVKTTRISPPLMPQ